MEKILDHERGLSPLSADTLGSFIYGSEEYQRLRTYLEAGPALSYSPNIYNKSRLQLIKDAYRYLPTAFNYHSNHGTNELVDVKHTYSVLFNPHQNPAGVHFGMFLKYIELMGTEEHKRKYLQKSMTLEIVGCYAQTELGHGSDIRSLETTAQYDSTTREWVINSPTISSGKYWPGELSFLANYAIVFAQAWIKGKNHGVLPFLVQIKDKDYNWLPGIEGGDIGPKIGFHAKENGFMYLRSVRVPKENLFTKYIEVSDSGQLKQVGDPRIGYGTMMFIREIISCTLPRLYGVAITIGARYSLFRRQFPDQDKRERTIMEYQTQQEKLIPRIAEYYAMAVGGNKIRAVSEQNRERVMKSDFSLLQETHSNLAFSKGLFSEIVQEGMQTVRRSMGGHGTSYYSGVPQLMNEYIANNTHQGENTVMYIQTARYVLKGYLGYVTKGKKPADSISYLTSFARLAGTRFTGKHHWTFQEIRDALVKAIGHVLTQVGSRIAKKSAEEGEADIINFKVGIRLQQLAQLHGVHFVVDELIAAVANAEASIRAVVGDLCKVFAIGQLQRLAAPVIEGGFICPLKWAQLQLEKEELLKRLRPHTAKLVDAFCIPEKFIRSEVVKGDPYLNFLNRARECEINTAVTDAARNVGRIRDVLAANPRL